MAFKLSFPVKVIVVVVKGGQKRKEKDSPEKRGGSPTLHGEFPLFHSNVQGGMK